MPSPSESVRVAYFSMEIALDPAMPTYSGGLGVLAGDTLRSAADLGAPLIGVTLLYRGGYFQQVLDAHGEQREEEDRWLPEDLLERLEPTVDVFIEGRKVKLCAWRYVLRGQTGAEVPVLLLDSDLPDNAPDDRALTRRLYAGDRRLRLFQEALLGFGGVRMLRALGHSSLDLYHMNEGHSALLALELVEEWLDGRPLETATEKDFAVVRRKCVFTTHTPVPAGHDRFARELVLQVLGEQHMKTLNQMGGFQDGELNMTYLALRASHYINGVAMRHGQVSHGMFPSYPIAAITNGVHAVTWTSRSMQELLDRNIPPWRTNNQYLRYAVGVPVQEVQQAHQEAKLALLSRIHDRTGVQLDPACLTIGFARRAAGYKRADLVFHDRDRLLHIARNVGPLQFVFGGKAHPQDAEGKAVIRRIFELAESLRGTIPVVYVENYDVEWAKLLVSGSDLWLNTPQRPQEASGTSGMKAALNGVPSLSVLDGWWVEGCVEGATGWAIGDDAEAPSDPEAEAASLYHKLERCIVPMFYGRPTAYGAVMRSAIALNGSYFNTERMVMQYLSNAYFPGAGARVGVPGWT
ncbi:MAG: alpha-glucan family phosphorylase [Acidobacteria bacterium]|nr:alpha-glucan family phosphorylase [Acidobacteriota bacterium]